MTMKTTRYARSRVDARSRVLAGAAAIAALALAACGSGTPGVPASEDGAGDGEGVPPASGGADRGGTEVEFWHRTFTPAENDWYKQVVADFNAAQDDVVVKVTEVPGDAWEQKMKAAQAAGKAPDIYTHPGPVYDAYRAGQVHALDGLIPQEKLEEIVPAGRLISEIDGSFYSYPIVLEPNSILFWNTDLVEAAGVDATAAPQTWEDLLAACEQIQPTLASGQFCISPAADGATMAWSTIGQQYNAAGHTALTPDWTASEIDVPGYRDLFDFYKEMYDAGYMPRQPLGDYGGAKDFGEGKVAYKVSGSWMLSEVGSDYPELLSRTGVGAFPQAPTGQGRTTTALGSFQWVIDARTTNAQAAADFMAWVLAGDPEILVPFFVDTQFTKVPPRAAVEQAVAASPDAAQAPWFEVITQEIAPTAIPEVIYPWDVMLAVGVAMETVMKGAGDPDSAIATAQASIDLIIEREDLPARAPQG